jgi:hypothetical protein
VTALSRSWKKLVVIAGTTLVALLSITAASASVPDSNDTIHACYTTSSGALRVIDTDNGGTCYNYETAISWSSTQPSVKYYDETVGTSCNSGTHVCQYSAICPAGEFPIWARGSGTPSLYFPNNDTTQPPTGFIISTSNQLGSTAEYQLACS